MPRPGDAFYLTGQDRTRIDRQFGRMRPDLGSPNVDDREMPLRALGYATADIPSMTYGELFLAKQSAASPPVLEPSDFTVKGFNVSSETILAETLCFQEPVRAAGGRLATLSPVGGVPSKWIWGTNLQQLNFGDSGLIRVVGGSEEQGSEQTVHYLAINGLEIEAELQILAVWALLDPADDLYGYLLVDAGCDEPPPLRWGGVIEPEEPEP